MADIHYEPRRSSKLNYCLILILLGACIIGCIVLAELIGVRNRHYAINSVQYSLKEAYHRGSEQSAGKAPFTSATWEKLLLPGGNHDEIRLFPSFVNADDIFASTQPVNVGSTNFTLFVRIGHHHYLALDGAGNVLGITGELTNRALYKRVHLESQ
jgi:hypothetical protein